MITIIRKYQKSLMLIVAVLTIIAFAWLYNPAEMKELGANVAAVGYGRTFSPAEIDRLARLYSLALALGQADLVSALTLQATDESSAMNEFIANLIVLRHESAALGIEPDTAQVAAKVREIRNFQTDGVFDPRKFEVFVNERLGPFGMTPLQIEEVMRDALRLERLREAVAGGIEISSSQINLLRRTFQKADLLLLKFPLEPVRASVNLTEEEMQNYFNQNRQFFVAPESLTLQYVRFQLGEDQLGLEGKERVAQLQEVAGRAAHFAEAVAGGGDFSELAGREGVEVATSKSVTRFDSGDLPSAVVRAAFFLRPDQLVSDVLQVGEEFFVFRVVERQPERNLEFEEARGEVERRLREAKAVQQVRARASAAVAQVREALASGKSPQEAVASSTAQVETLSGITPGEPGVPPEFATCSAVAPLLQPGMISNPLPAGDGLAAVLVLSRGIAVEPESRLEQVREDFTQADRELVLASWLAAQRQAAGLRAAKRQ